MNFRPYDILTQLIPGILLVGFCVFATDFKFAEIEFNTAHYAFGTVVCFIVGYVINGIGHMFETSLSTGLRKKVFESYKNGTVSKLLWPLKLFTKLQSINNKKPNLPDKLSEIFDEMNSEKYQKLAWQNQDKKFARSIIVTSISLLCFYLIIGLKISLIDYSNYILSFILLLLFISIYRYIQSSIDYTIWVIKFYEKKNKLE